MARPARRIEISEEDDARLRELELSPHTHPKARLRASILRLHRAGWSIPQLSKHFDRNHQAIHNDLTRFEEDGMSGLTDGCAPGRRSAVTPEVEQFLHEKLQEQRFWNAPLLCEEIERQLQIVIRPRALGNHLQRLGYSWKRARDSPAKKLDPEGVQQHQRALETLKKGALDGRLTLKYLDQTGLSLMLSIGGTWFRRGSGPQFEIPTRWGSAGRINLIGTSSFQGREERLQVRKLQGTCNTQQVIADLETLAAGCTPDRLTVVVLDNVPFHKGAQFAEKITQWEEKGL